MHRKNDSTGGDASQPNVVGFGLLTLGTLIIVDELPETNTGMKTKRVDEYLTDDATIAVVALRRWGIDSGMIGTKLGRDATGRKAIRKLKHLGVAGSFRMTSKYGTPLEVSVADKSGNRTYYWDRPEGVLGTLDDADLSMINTASFLYVDWYDHPHIQRALEVAKESGVQTFLNIEYGHANPEMLSLYGGYSTVVQAVTDAAQVNQDPEETAERLLDAGASVALVTLARGGCLARTKDESVRVYAPTIEAVDANGAGAIFSAGYMYGALQGWGLEGCARFAVAAATLKCTQVGLDAFPVTEIEALATQLTIG